MLSIVAYIMGSIRRPTRPQAQTHVPRSAPRAHTGSCGHYPKICRRISFHAARRSSAAAPSNSTDLFSIARRPR